MKLRKLKVLGIIRLLGALLLGVFRGFRPFGWRKVRHSFFRPCGTFFWYRQRAQVLLWNRHFHFCLYRMTIISTKLKRIVLPTFYFSMKLFSCSKSMNALMYNIKYDNNLHVIKKSFAMSHITHLSVSLFLTLSLFVTKLIEDMLYGSEVKE